jgi:hypothetical protein
VLIKLFTEFISSLKKNPIMFSLCAYRSAELLNSLPRFKENKIYNTFQTLFNFRYIFLYHERSSFCETFDDSITQFLAPLITFYCFFMQHKQRTLPRRKTVLRVIGVDVVSSIVFCRSVAIEYEQKRGVSKFRVLVHLLRLRHPVHLIYNLRQVQIYIHLHRTA